MWTDHARFFKSNPSTDPRGYKKTHPSPFSFASKIIATEDEIRLRIDSLAKEIADDYRRVGLLDSSAAGSSDSAIHQTLTNAISKENPLCIVSVLKGSYTFTADLARALFRHGVFSSVEFLSTQSYVGTETTGSVSLIMDVKTPVSGRHVLILEDILDTAHTLTYLVKDLFSKRNAASLKVCVFLDKPEGRRMPFSADHVGFYVANEFVVGYGIDFSNRFRELPFVAVLDRSEYERPPKLKKSISVTCRGKAVVPACNGVSKL